MTQVSTMQGDRPNVGILTLFASLVGLLVPALWVLTTLTPSDNLARLRNSFGAKLGEQADFDWRPPTAPQTFLQNESEPSSDFKGLVKRIRQAQSRKDSDGLDFALAASKELMRAQKRNDQPIRGSGLSTYTAITDKGWGYCADFAKVFNAMSLTAGVPVRQWGIAFDGFGAGHTFNEVYDAARQKWILVDSFHSLYFVDYESGEPLSVIEVHDRLLRIGHDSRPIRIVRIVPDKVPFRSDDLALDYYRRGMTQLWLVWGNNIFDYESSFAGWVESRVHRSIGQALGIVLGDYPTIRVYRAGMSRRDFNQLLEARNEFLLASACLAVSVVLFPWLAIRQIHLGKSLAMRSRTE